MCYRPPPSQFCFTRYQETKDESARKQKRKKQDERRGCLFQGPCPVDLTDGPRVGDPCNAYNEWDLVVRLASAGARSTKGAKERSNVLGRSSRERACVAGGSRWYLVSRDVRIEALDGSQCFVSAEFEINDPSRLSVQQTRQFRVDGCSNPPYDLHHLQYVHVCMQQ